MTRAPDLIDADFLASALELLPTGPAWSREPDGTLARFWHAIADQLAALHQRSLVLLETEADPAKAGLLLADWERAFGLPDDCSPHLIYDAESDVYVERSVQERRAQLLARIGSTGGQSRAYFIALAASLGFEITIEEFRPFRADRSRAGDRLYDMPWPFTWRVHAPAQTLVYFRTDRSTAGERLTSVGNQTLECVFEHLKPAHTNVLFSYGS